MKSRRYAPFRWIVSLGLVVFYTHFLHIYPPVQLNPALEAANPSFDFLATAYAVEGITASGLPTQRGFVAADPKLLPLGSIIEVDAPGHAGIYRVADTGPLVRGRRIDIFIPGHQRAAQFGHKRVKVKVLQFGKRRSRAEQP